MDIHNHRILILDFGSQYSQLIARRIRELGVYCELYPYNANPEKIQAFLPNGVILSGGPDSVHSEAPPTAPNCVFELGCPVLGICYGMQTIISQFGGTVSHSQKREYGQARCEITCDNLLLKDIIDEGSAEGKFFLEVWMSHGDQIVDLPDGFVTIASTPNTPYAGVMDKAGKVYGLQFHPEVSHTRQGQRILERFVKNICGCNALWTSSNIIEGLTRNIKKQIGNEQVVLGLSGGVDSAVVATLLQKAVGSQLHCVFVDNGLLRQDEAKQVLSTFRDNMGIDVIHVDASARFLSALEGASDPEEKRKIIGKVFINIFEEQAGVLSGVKFLAQGTIYPDVIESAGGISGKADVIKSHHNVGGLPDMMQLELIEPLRELFKDEVRKIGLELGLPYDMVYRHPFPGPGLAVRVLGEVKESALTILRKADHIFISELIAAGFYDKVSQAFAVFLPIQTVAVKGDARCYSHVIALRSVDSVDYMTAHASVLPFDFITKVADRICNEVEGVSRVVYDCSSKPPATIEWE